MGCHYIWFQPFEQRLFTSPWDIPTLQLLPNVDVNNQSRPMLRLHCHQFCLPPSVSQSSDSIQQSLGAVPPTLVTFLVVPHPIHFLIFLFLLTKRNGVLRLWNLSIATMGTAAFSSNLFVRQWKGDASYVAVRDQEDNMLQDWHSDTQTATDGYEGSVFGKKNNDSCHTPSAW